MFVDVHSVNERQSERSERVSLTSESFWNMSSSDLGFASGLALFHGVKCHIFAKRVFGRCVGGDPTAR